ncbi:MAG: glycosyltransferase family 4 protein [Candidatus Paceibacterota bacterium]|jgi:glycosyltransferase involved in cell wall biosynthesis
MAMKLLILTQKINKADPVLGFFHRWLLAFATNFEKITVICLELGEYDLPANVQVLSLGKEQGKSRVKYLRNFYKYIWQTRHDYDVVFVHMNQEYILLGALIWKILGKKTAFWYNHTCGNFLTKIAMFMADIVCHTSPFAYTAGTKKSRRMPAGIDMTFFKPDEKISQKSKNIMYIGRIAPLKKVDVLIEAARILDREEIDFVLDIYGAALDKDSDYFDQLKKSSAELQAKGKLFFRGAVSNQLTPEIFNSHLISVNLTPRGNYDKTVLEGMACGTLPLVSSPAFNDIIPVEFRFKENEADDLVEKIESVFSLSETAVTQHGSNCRQAVGQNHDLVLLATNLATLFNSPQAC